MYYPKLKSVVHLGIIFMATTMFSQNRFDKVTIESKKLTENTYMLVGSGGNIGVSIGTDGTFIIDDQFAPLTEKIVATLKQLSDKPIKVVMNTHHHADHTGGNENFGKLGATIMAHDNVKKRLKDNSTAIALPTITFNDKLTLNINGEDVLALHVANAHTDGDTMLYFTESNLLHTGDTFFNRRYPYIDLSAGGSVDGYINAVKTGLMLVDDNTKIIPGHGDLANKADYEAFLNMLETLKTNVLSAIENGKTEDEVANDNEITKTYDALDYGCCFISSEKIKRTFYTSLKP